MAEPHAKLAKQNKICYSANGTSRLPIKDYSKQFFFFVNKTIVNKIQLIQHYLFDFYNHHFTFSPWLEYINK